LEVYFNLSKDVRFHQFLVPLLHFKTACFFQALLKHYTEVLLCFCTHISILQESH